MNTKLFHYEEYKPHKVKNGTQSVDTDISEMYVSN